MHHRTSSRGRFAAALTATLATLLLSVPAFAHANMTRAQHEAAVRDASRLLKQHTKEFRDEMAFAKDELEMTRFRVDNRLAEVRERLRNNRDLCERGLLEQEAGELEEDVRTCDEVLRDDERAVKSRLHSGRAEIQDALDNVRDVHRKWKDTLEADRTRLARARRSLDRHAIGK